MSEEVLPVGVHLVGSVPLGSAEEVFRRSAAALADRLRRIPDGETGPRSDWIVWQYPVFSSRPQFEVGPPESASYRALPQLRLRTGEPTADMTFDELGYSNAAITSHRIFARLKRDGEIPPSCRFLVSLPTPLAPVSAFVAIEDQARLEPLYESRMSAEIDQILAAIPADQLAIQWDARLEFAMLEGAVHVWFDDVRAGVLERLLRLSRQIPREVELGYHLCYGDEEHGHFVEPQDTGKLVSIANALAASLDRTAELDPHAGAPGAHRRRLVRAALAARAGPGDRALPRTDPPRGRRRRGARADRRRPPPRAGLRRGDRVRLGPRRGGRRRRPARPAPRGHGAAAGRRREGVGGVRLAARLRADTRRRLDHQRGRRGGDRLRQRRGARLVRQPRFHRRGACHRPARRRRPARLLGRYRHLLDRLRLRIFDRQIGTLIVDASAKFLRVALEKYRDDPLVALRLLRFVKEEKRLQSLDEVLDAPLAQRGADAIACTNAVHLYPNLEETFAAWTRALRPGGRVYINSGNLRNPRAAASEWIIDETVWVINDLAEGLVRSDERYAAYRPVLENTDRMKAHATQRDKVFLQPRALEVYLDALRAAGLTVTGVREQTIEAGVQEWFEFLSAYHDAVLGWVGGTKKLDGEAPSAEAVEDRLKLMRHAMDVLFGGRPTFNTCWTYVTCERAG